MLSYPSDTPGAGLVCLLSGESIISSYHSGWETKQKDTDLGELCACLTAKDKAESEIPKWHTFLFKLYFRLNCIGQLL